jgi:hypothetical protein
MHHVRILLLVFVGVLVAGCGGATATGSGSASSPDAPDAADGALYGEVTTVGGEQLDGAAYRNVDLALWFWAPW